MTGIYDQHQSAFTSVSAFAVLDKGEHVATVAFKYPRDGAGRLYAYVQWFGVEMVRGFASGGNYDKHSAACASAVRHMQDKSLEHWSENDIARYDQFRAEMFKDDGYRWDARLRGLGFTVVQAV